MDIEFDNRYHLKMIMPSLLPLRVMRLFLLPSVFLLQLAVYATAGSFGQEIVVYSARNEQLIRPLFEAYTRESGIRVQFITDKEGPLLSRLQAEGPHTAADLLMTVDAGTLWFAAKEGLLQPAVSQVLDQNIPEHLRDPDRRWFGLSVRARTIVYHTGKVVTSDLSTYEALADPKWRGRLCLRTAKKVYNQSLIATMIVALGTSETEGVVRSWVRNLATDVFPDDTKVMEAVAAGQCDVGVVNSYYYGRLMQKRPDLPLKLYWPNQNDRGVHVNISGAGVTRYARHAREAIALLEWLSSEKGQHLFSDLNLEYPANPSVAPDPVVSSWGSFKQDRMPVFKAGALQGDAIRLMDRAGYK